MLFNGPAEHAENAPETWQVRKVGDRRWEIATKDGIQLDTATTKKGAESLRTGGHVANLYGQESRWYAGENINNWKPYTEVLAERERMAAWLARKAEERMGTRPDPQLSDGAIQLRRQARKGVDV